MLIDESQDIPKSFFDLCEKVTKKNVYVAGDIFQSIFDDNIVTEIQPDFLLSKCYRTDPKTLMFAHAVGMGLFENPKIRWLEDDEWKKCGYIVKKENSRKYKLSREPLRRFEDLEEASSIDLVLTSRETGLDSEDMILGIIRDIRSENPTVLVDDIGIIFVDSANYIYALADRLEISIESEFGWEVNKAYETKQKIKNTLFISNRNNVKGLEFPFIICIAKTLNSAPHYRNALYMMLTRSFIKTYFLISKDLNPELSVKLEDGLNVIQEKGQLEITAPSTEERAIIKTKIKYDKEDISLYDLAYEVFDDLEILPLFRSDLLDIVKKTLDEKNFDHVDVRDIIEFNYKKMANSKK
jgi:superfamily I DNA and RNA helicase